jgi:hypothetical protein
MQLYGIVDLDLEGTYAGMFAERTGHVDISFQNYNTHAIANDGTPPHGLSSNTNTLLRVGSTLLGGGVVPVWI